MRTFKLYFTVLFILSVLSGCGKSDNKTTENKSADQKTEIKQGTEQSNNKSTGQTEVIEIKLPTMQCGTCKKNIEGAVKKLDGVEDVNVTVKEKTATVKFDKSKTDLSKIEGVIVSAGYQANDKPANKEAYDKLEDCCKIGGHDK
jgi:copper chaperone CopZ